MCSVNNDAVPAEIDETQSHMKPVIVLETLNVARYVALSENSVGWEMHCHQSKLKAHFSCGSVS